MILLTFVLLQISVDKDDIELISIYLFLIGGLVL